MLTILGRISSINVRKVLWTAEELDLAIVHDRMDSGAPADGGQVLAELNPNRQVPVLVEDGFVLWESQAIMRYLCALAGDTTLYPKAPRERARIDQWLDWHATEHNPAWGYAFMALVRKVPGHEDSSRITASIETWNRRIELLDTHLSKSGGHVAGDGFTLADISTALGVHRWLGTPIPGRPHAPHVATYMARLSARPAFARFCAAETP